MGAAAVLRVSLRLPAAWRAEAGVLYALPAGEPGRAVADPLPHVDVAPSTSEATLPLPQSGAWDVGYRGPFGHVLVQDVDASGITDLTVDARAAAPIRFRLRSREAIPANSSVRVSHDDGVGYPGRSEWSSVSVRVELGEAKDLQTPPLAPGTVYRLDAYAPLASRAPGGVPGFDWLPARETARAGDEVDLVAVRLGLIRVNLEIDPVLPETWRKVWFSGRYVWVGVDAQGERDPEPRHAVGTALHEDGRFQDPQLQLPLAPGRYALHMHPDPLLFQRAATPVEVTAGEVLDLRVRATPDAGRDPWQPSPLQVEESATRVRIEIAPAPAAAWFLVLEVDEGGTLGLIRDGGGSGEGVVEVESLQPARRGLVIVPPDRASEGFRVPARGKLQPRLLPAGHLVLVPEVLPDPRLGAFQVRRADRLPLPRQSEERAKLEIDMQWPITMGLILGPIPEGELPLEVLLGGTVVARPVANVKAGLFVPLAIPVRSGLDR